MGLVSGDRWLVIQSEQNEETQESVNAGIDGWWETVDSLDMEGREATQVCVAVRPSGYSSDLKRERYQVRVVYRSLVIG
jgi:hypothetical protein